MSLTERAGQVSLCVQRRPTMAPSGPISRRCSLVSRPGHPHGPQVSRSTTRRRPAVAAVHRQIEPAMPALLPEHIPPLPVSGQSQGELVTVRRTQGPSNPRSPACVPIRAKRASAAAWLWVVGALMLIEDVLEELVVGEELMLLIAVGPLEPDGM